MSTVNDLRIEGWLKIIVNGADMQTPPKPLSYETLVDLAGKKPGVLYTVTYYSRGGSGGLNGSLVPGQSVLPVEGTVFNVTFTGGA